MMDIAEIIQLAVAPVFLLVAIGSLLNVVTGRLGRVIDRARSLEQDLIAGLDARERAHHQHELRVLDGRMRHNHRSINLLSSAGLAIAFLVAALFLSDLLVFDASGLVAVLFVAAMSLIIAGIGFFLAEVNIATRTVRVRTELLRDADEKGPDTHE